MAPHTHSLDLAEFSEPIDRDHETKDGAPGRDTPKTEIRFFDEVLEIHAVEGSNEGAGCDREGEDGEFEVEEHEGVAVGV